MPTPTSTFDPLTRQILHFLSLPQPTRIAKSYRTEPNAAMGVLWLRLNTQMRTTPSPIRDLAKWVHVNGLCILKTYLRHEARFRVHQTQRPL